jgi:hypothetical protein
MQQPGYNQLRLPTNRPCDPSRQVQCSTLDPEARALSLRNCRRLGLAICVIKHVAMGRRAWDLRIVQRENKASQELVILKHIRLRRRRQITNGQTNLMSVDDNGTLKSNVDQDSNWPKGDDYRCRHAATAARGMAFSSRQEFDIWATCESAADYRTTGRPRKGTCPLIGQPGSNALTRVGIVVTVCNSRRNVGA